MTALRVASPQFRCKTDRHCSLSQFEQPQVMGAGSWLEERQARTLWRLCSRIKVPKIVSNTPQIPLSVPQINQFHVLQQPTHWQPWNWKLGPRPPSSARGSGCSPWPSSSSASADSWRPSPWAWHGRTSAPSFPSSGTRIAYLLIYLSNINFINFFIY